MTVHDIPAQYEATIGLMQRRVRANRAGAAGDPHRAAEIIVTNTLPVRPDQEFDKLTVLSIAPLLAQAIREVFEDGSVTSLFAGRS